MTRETAKRVLDHVNCNWKKSYHLAITRNDNWTEDYYDEEEALKALMEIGTKEVFFVQAGRWFSYDPHNDDVLPWNEIDWDSYTEEEQDQIRCDERYWGDENEWELPRRQYFRLEEKVVCIEDSYEAELGECYYEEV